MFTSKKASNLIFGLEVAIDEMRTQVIDRLYNTQTHNVWIELNFFSLAPNRDGLAADDDDDDGREIHFRIW